jgi:hypothetical protein
MSQKRVEPAPSVRKIVTRYDCFVTSTPTPPSPASRADVCSIRLASRASELTPARREVVEASSNDDESRPPVTSSRDAPYTCGMASEDSELSPVRIAEPFVDRIARLTRLPVPSKVADP